MRRKIMIYMLVMSALLCSCAAVDDGTQTNESSSSLTEQSTAETTAETAKSEETTEIVTEKASETTSEAETVVNVPDEDRIRTLLDENLNCVLKIFCMGGLAHEDEPVSGDMIYKVSSDEFKTLSDLENYLLTVYTAECTDMLLNDYPYEDTSMYLDIDGELCIDLNLAGAKGYYVDWSNPEITIKSSDGNRCEFTVKCRVEEPAAEPVYTDYFVDGTLVYENGSWVLEKMLY